MLSRCQCPGHHTQGILRNVCWADLSWQERHGSKFTISVLLICGFFLQMPRNQSSWVWGCTPLRGTQEGGGRLYIWIFPASIVTPSLQSQAMKRKTNKQFKCQAVTPALRRQRQVSLNSIPVFWGSYALPLGNSNILNTYSVHQEWCGFNLCQTVKLNSVPDAATLVYSFSV